MSGNKLTPREQGDLGELSAMEWLASKGAHIYIPVGHSPDVDLIADIGAGLIRIEVKTCTFQNKLGRWEAHIATNGGNQSWSGRVKYFDPDRCEYLFVHTGEGRRWFIPTAALDCKAGLTLGGPKYSAFEIEPGRPLAMVPEATGLESAFSAALAGGVSKRTKDGDCKSSGTAFAGSNPASPIASPKLSLKPSNRERSLGRSGHAVINQKRRMTIPQSAFFEAGLVNGSKLRVRSDGPGRIIVEQVELPAWARSTPDED
jgi:PD-(D/E)XK endonuclease